MTLAEARAFLESIAYVPGHSNTREPRFDPERRPRAERAAAAERISQIKQACRVILDHELAATTASQKTSEEG